MKCGAYFDSACVKVRGVKKKKNFERLVENLLQICENCAFGKNLCISRLTMTSVKSLCENMPFRSSAKYEEVSEIGNGKLSSSLDTSSSAVLGQNVVEFPIFHHISPQFVHLKLFHCSRICKKCPDAIFCPFDRSIRYSFQSNRQTKSRSGGCTQKGPC